MAQENPPAHEFRTLTCAHCGFQIRVSIDCKFRFCSICAPRRSARIARRLAFLILNTEKIDNYRFKMLTLSMSNCSDIEAGIQALVSNFRRLRYRALWKRYVVSGAFVIEVTGRPGNWHPHIHAIIYSRFIPWRKLASTWKQISGGSGCHITAVDPNKAAAYVNKYISKSQVPNHLQRPLSDALRRFRLFQRFGAWHSLRIPRRLYDYPCDNCKKTDWLSSQQIDYGHYRQVKSLAEI